MQEHKKQVVSTRLEKFYTIINQAVIMSELDHGDKKDWDIKYCSKNSNCLDKYNEYFGKYLQNIKINELDNSNIMVYFSDGSLMIMKDGYDIFFYPEAKNFNLDTFKDEDFNRKDAGKKFFAFQFNPNNSDENHIHHYNKGVEPYKAWLPKDFTRDDFFKGEFACAESNKYKGYCTSLIQYEGWKIPKDYPFRL